MIKFRRRLPIVVLVSALLNITPSFADSDFFKEMGIKRIEPSGPVTHFSLPTREDRNSDLSALKGDVILINFWATWCTPCLTEMPALNSLHEKYKDQGFSLLAINADPHQKQRIETVVNKLALTFPVLLDTDGAVSKQFKVSGMPASFLINRQHQLIGYVAGARDWDGKSAYQMIEKLLAQTTE